MADALPGNLAIHNLAVDSGGNVVGMLGCLAPNAIIVRNLADPVAIRLLAVREEDARRL